jgi:hypothetical protein
LAVSQYYRSLRKLCGSEFIANVGVRDLSWRKGTGVSGNEYNVWIKQVIAGYGGAKSSMLQDFERGRRTEIDFINGYVAQLGGKAGVPVSMNAAITDLVHLIEQGKSEPHAARLQELLKQSSGFSVGSKSAASKL